jgi:hypothetical protein
MRAARSCLARHEGGVPLESRSRVASTHSLSHSQSRLSSVCSSFAELVIAEDSDDLQCAVVLSLRYCGGTHVPFSSRSVDALHFVPFLPPKEEIVTLDSIVCMLSYNCQLICRDGKQWGAPHKFRFHIACLQCGREYSVSVVCEPDGGHAALTTIQCCGHFSMGFLPPKDKRCATHFVTNSQVRENLHYASTHPLRVMGRL